MIDLSLLTTAVEIGDHATAVALTGQAINERVDPQAILAAMTAAMDTVGARFQSNEIFIPEMLVAARAMKKALERLKPELAGAGLRPEATAVLGTVEGDLHDIGKNLVGMMWAGANIEVVDLGENVPPWRFVEAVKEHGARLVGISALLTTTMVGMKDVVSGIRAADLSDVKIVIGGAPITEGFAKEIGADGYAKDAGAAVVVAKRLLSNP
jgi:5-methyltetrahydrofolate--homocysteine methyltransferase